ncbi:MAG: hypothetical protein SX243_07365 [Acidobacteriota bacterium]|nr:hypothetical protein [Acidobacteriota bacterium]
MSTYRSSRIAAWSFLGLLLTANLVAAVLFDRSQWPGLVGDEATYLMQAESLAYDLDLRYSREDYDRFVELHGQPPEGLILQSRDDGGHMVYSKPFLYALALAPAVRVAPEKGPAVINALLLALAALMAARSLERLQGAGGPVWVAVWVFASVAFAYTFWSHADLFLMCATAAGFALATGSVTPVRGAMPEIFDQDPEERPDSRFALRWLAVGVLLAIPGAFRPFYLTLLLPALMMVPPRHALRARTLILVPALAVLALTAGVQWVSGGSWSSYGGERQGFYQRTGFPEVDFPAGGWDESVERWGNTSWLHEDLFEVETDPKLLGWNALYALAGANVGVLPYFLPLFLGLLAGGWTRQRSWLLAAVLVSMAAFLIFRPFNFYGGAGAIANRYFLPLFPALWFGGHRELRGRWALLAAALAAPLMLPTWSQPWAYPVRAEGGYHHVNTLARSYLPYETSQSHLPRASEDISYGGIWLRFPDPTIWPQDGRLRILGGTQSRLLVGSPTVLRGLELTLAPPATTALTVDGAEVGEMRFEPNGTFHVALELAEPDRHHAMWWTSTPQYLYLLTLRLDETPERPVPMSLTPLFGSDP